MSKKISLILIPLLIFSCQMKKTFNPELASLLDSLAEQDQRILAQLDTCPELALPFIKEQANHIFVSNCESIKTVFRNSGYLGADLVGESSSHNFWLIVQHSDHDVDFQEEVLGKMYKEVTNDNASKVDMAYLVDRVNINRGRPQIYGTQVYYDENNEPYPKDIEDISKVDSLRTTVGLEEIKYYLSLMKALKAKPGDKIDIIVNVPK